MTILKGKKLISALLALTMVLSLLPAGALAAEAEGEDAGTSAPAVTTPAQSTPAATAEPETTGEPAPVQPEPTAADSAQPTPAQDAESETAQTASPAPTASPAATQQPEPAPAGTAQPGPAPSTAPTPPPAVNSLLTAPQEPSQEDIEAAQAVEWNIVRYLPAAADVVIGDTSSINKAVEDYENLTETQKLLVAPEAVEKLFSARDALRGLQEQRDAENRAAVGAVVAKIDALPDAEYVTGDQYASVADAIAAFDALSYDQKMLLVSEYERTYLKLDALDKALAQLWNTLPSTLEDGTLDLSAYAVSPDAGGRSISVSGSVTLIGAGEATSFSGLELVIKEDAELTVRDVYLNNAAKMSCITLENGAALTLISEGGGNKLTARPNAISLGEGAALKIEGPSLLNLAGNITGGERVEFDGNVKFSPKNVSSGEIVVSGGSLSGASELKGALRVTGGAVGVETVAGPLTISGGTLTLATKSYPDGKLSGAAAVAGGRLTVYGNVAGNVTVTGGAADVYGSVKGNADIKDGSLNVISSRGHALEGTLNVSDGAKASFTGSTSGDLVISGAIAVADGAFFSAVGYGAQAVSGDAVNGVILRGSFEEELDSGKTLVVNDNQEHAFVMPVNACSFAVAVASADKLTVADAYGENRVVRAGQTGTPAELTLTGDNAGLAIEPTGIFAGYFIDRDNIIVTSEDDVLCVTYNGATRPLEDDVLHVGQGAGTTANSIVVKPGVRGLTLELSGVSISSDNLSCIYLRPNTQTTLVLSGENQLTCGTYAGCIDVGSGSELTIEGTGALHATAEGSGVAIGTIFPPANAYSEKFQEKGDVEDRTVPLISDAFRYPTIRILSGEITAVSGSGSAGIGGGFTDQRGGVNGDGSRIGFAGGNIEISGGTIYAKGGTGGAGIGGGQYGDSGSITISGTAVVTAVGGGNGGAGIGGGEYSRGGGWNGHGTGAVKEIAIKEEAEVWAMGGTGAAAIGRGRFATAELPEGAITIEAGTKLTAFSDGAFYAVDTNGSETGLPGSAPILNARFAKGVMTYQPEHGNPICVLSRDESMEPIELILTSNGSNSPVRAFAVTVPAGGTYLVQNGAAGKTLQRAYADDVDDGISAQDAFLYAVGGTMNTRDELRFASFRVTGSVSGGTGSLSVDGTGIEAAPRGDVTLAVTPGSGYTLSSLAVNGAGVTQSVANGSYTIADIRQDMAVVAAFGASGTTGGGDTPGGGTDPTPPSTVPEDIIPEEETPLSPLPVEVPEETDIPDGETPLAPAPEQDAGVEIGEDEVPLGDLPQTGAIASRADNGVTLGMLALAISLALAGLAVSGGRRKQGQEN